jgi:hypothetical protein
LKWNVRKYSDVYWLRRRTPVLEHGVLTRIFGAHESREFLEQLNNCE